MQNRLNKLIRCVASLLICAAIPACGGHSLRVEGYGQTVAVPGRPPLTAWMLGRDPMRSIKSTRAVVLFLEGSRAAPAISRFEALAGFSRLNMTVVLTDREASEKSSAVATPTRNERIQDARAALSYALEQAPRDVPVLVIGVSEGGDIAAAVSAREPRVTHLVLLGSGGGLSIESELATLIRRNVGVGRVLTMQKLAHALVAIRANPESEEKFLGLPYRRWASYLDRTIVGELERSQAQVLLIHGALDENVPVESARELKRIAGSDGRISYVELPQQGHRLAQSGGCNGRPKIEVIVTRWMEQSGMILASDRERSLRQIRTAHPDCSL